MEGLLNREKAPQWVTEELTRICGVIEKNMERFGTKFPSACAEGGVYEVTENDGCSGWHTSIPGKRSSGILPAKI